MLGLGRQGLLVTRRHLLHPAHRHLQGGREVGRETDRRVRAPFPPRHEVLPPQEKPDTVIPPPPEPHSHVHPRWHQGGGRLCRQNQHQPSSPYRGSPGATSPPWSPPGMLRTSPPQGPAAEEQHPSIELSPHGVHGAGEGSTSQRERQRWMERYHSCRVRGKVASWPRQHFGGERGLLLVQDVGAHSPPGRCQKAHLAT